jgi:prepilin-type N-terminal cleavage/methylation domain-containing protein
MQTNSRLQPTQATRRGFSLIELIVAATLLIGAMSIVAPLAVRSARLQQDSQHYQLALDELSNQLERLTGLDADALETALAKLTPSPTVRDVLPHPVLSAETIVDDDGRRLVLQLQWDRVGPARPLTLVAWLDPPTTNPEEPSP